MRYSVYHHGTRRYDYYEDGRPEGTHASAPPRSALGGLASGNGGGSLGAVPEAATWRLPWGAKKVGTGPLPQGRIASMGGTALGELVEFGPIPLSAIVMAGVGYLAWRIFK